MINFYLFFFFQQRQFQKLAWSCFVVRLRQKLLLIIRKLWEKLSSTSVMMTHLKVRWRCACKFFKKTFFSPLKSSNFFLSTLFTQKTQKFRFRLSHTQSLDRNWTTIAKYRARRSHWQTRTWFGSWWSGIFFFSLSSQMNAPGVFVSKKICFKKY